MSPGGAVEVPAGPARDEALAAPVSGSSDLEDVPALDAGLPDAAPVAYKRPESVLVVVFNWRGELLLIRRSRPADFWQSVTGSLKVGEGAHAAAVRELREETGLRVSPSHLVSLHHSVRFPILPAWRARYAPGVHYNREHWFALPLPGRRLIRLDPEEHLEYCWVPTSRALTMARSWTNRDAILTLVRYVSAVALLAQPLSR